MAAINRGVVLCVSQQRRRTTSTKPDFELQPRIRAASLMTVEDGRMAAKATGVSPIYVVTPTQRDQLVVTGVLPSKGGSSTSRQYWS